jgi:hypothetical protein
MNRVTVTDWGNKLSAKQCLRKIFSDANRIEDALKQTPYTTPGLPSRKLAEAFAACVVNNCRGKATLK